MLEMGVDAVLVRSSDRFLNEYVPVQESARVWLTGYTGSMGEVLVAPDRAFLAVDARYWLQAERELDLENWQLIKVRLGAQLDGALSEQLVTLARAHQEKRFRVGFEPDRMTPDTLETFKSALSEVSGVTWKPLFPSPVEAARGSERPPPQLPEIRAVDEGRLGKTVETKLSEVGLMLEAADADALLLQRLDEIMWLANLRGSELPFQATFKCIALATAERLFVGVDPSKVSGPVRRAREPVLFVPEAELWSLVGRKAKRKRVAFDPANNTLQARMQLEKVGAQVVELKAPLQRVRARKNDEEIATMQDAFRKADRVVEQSIAWACRSVVDGASISEADLAEEVTRRFLEAGATGLSFKVISAAGENGAYIHYGPPSSSRLLTRGELVLLDTGAYFAEGYATDLTRTFLVGDVDDVGTEDQRRRYTLVLKAAISGMRAVVPEGASGSQLDAIVRAPLWAEGLDYAHGTGHGVGINVHEFPPRIGPTSTTPLELGHVFSVEPGLYDPSFGGIRIENLCTLEKGPPGFLRVRPMTFSPLDARLIESKRLNAEEKGFLKWFNKQYPPHTATGGGKTGDLRRVRTRPSSLPPGGASP